MNTRTEYALVLLERRRVRVRERAKKLTGRPRMAAIGEANVIDAAHELLTKAGDLPAAIDAVQASVLRAEARRELTVLQERIRRGAIGGASAAHVRLAMQARAVVDDVRALCQLGLLDGEAVGRGATPAEEPAGGDRPDEFDLRGRFG